jgi:hypothetical protein
MAQALSRFSPIHLPSFWSDSQKALQKKEIDKLTNQVVRDSFTELGVVFAYTGFSCLFVASLSGVTTLLIASTCVVALNALFRYIKLLNVPTLDKKDQPSEKTFIYRCLGWNFAFLDSATRDVLVHEFGHAACSTLLYKNSSLSITLLPFLGGVTSYTPEALRSLGKLVGENAAGILVSLAGPLATLLFTSTALIISHLIKENHPQLHEYMNTSILLSVVQQLLYALSALETSGEELSHDFVYLWAIGGIHPLLCAAFICLIPLVIKMVLRQIERDMQTAPPLKKRVHFPYLFHTNAQPA